jgi:hypothetical protein
MRYVICWDGLGLVTPGTAEFDFYAKIRPVRAF